MRIAVIGASIVATLVTATFVAALVPSVGLAQRPSLPSGAGGGLIAVERAVGDHHQQLTVIDPELRVVSVYHIDLATGEIVLKSVRKILWDLQMREFNGSSPLPQEIRSLLDQK